MKPKTQYFMENWRRRIEDQPQTEIDRRENTLKDKIVSAETLPRGPYPKEKPKPMII